MSEKLAAAWCFAIAYLVLLVLGAIYAIDAMIAARSARRSGAKPEQRPQSKPPVTQKLPTEGTQE